MELDSVCVFCGSSAGTKDDYRLAAQEVGATLARQKIQLVYGGGNVGLMGVLADACLAEGGKVVGVIPRALVDKEVAHSGLTQMHIVDSMHTRKATMARLSDAFVALPGGLGTFEEFFEVLTWAQLGFHSKPCGLLNVAGYYDPLLAMFEHTVAEGFVRPAHREMVLVDASLDRLLARMRRFEPLCADKWTYSDLK